MDSFLFFWEKSVQFLNLSWRSASEKKGNEDKIRLSWRTKEPVTLFAFGHEESHGSSKEDCFSPKQMPTERTMVRVELPEALEATVSGRPFAVSAQQ